MIHEEKGQEQPREDVIRVATCGLTSGFVKALSHYCEEHYPFVEIMEGGETITELLHVIEKNSIDAAIVKLSSFTNLEEEQLQLKQTSLAKLLITTEFLDTFKVNMVIHEPFTTLLYEHTPIRILVERLLTFESKKKLRLYTNVHPENRNQSKQKTVLIYSAKGGVGKTTIALNMAIELTKKNKKVLLIDFATFGNISVMFNLPRQVRGLAEAISYLEQPAWETEELRGYVEEGIYSVPVQGKRMDVLSAASPMKMTSLDISKTDEIMKAVSQMDYDVIVLDTSADLSEKNVSLISMATDILYVTTIDIAANSALLSTIELVETLNRPFQNRYLVVNQYNDSLGFPIAELEQILSMTIAVVIPDKYEQIQGYANRGILVTEKPNLKINRCYRQIAHLIEPVFTDKELGKKRKLFRVGGGKR